MNHNTRQLLAYVAGPYRDKRGEYFVEQNIQRAKDISIFLWQLGFTAICPHLNTARFGGACPDEVWLEGDFVILSRCNLCVLVPGWRRSEGALAEVHFCLDHDIPVFKHEDDAALLSQIAVWGHIPNPWRELNRNIL